MQEWLAVATRTAIQAFDLLALFVLVVGTIEVAINASRTMFNPRVTRAELRHVWLRYARWLVAALTLQLAADIAETAIAPGWAEIGRLGAIAVIRTFLDYFLERDVSEFRGFGRPAPATDPAVGAG